MARKPRKKKTAAAKKSTRRRRGTPEDPPAEPRADEVTAKVITSQTVTRQNVGAAVQAAVSFANARRVVADAVDETLASYVITWE